MTVKQFHYERLLTDYSNHETAIALLKRYRPYLEMIPSMRRSDESIITIPLPVVRVRQPILHAEHSPITSQRRTIRLPCDVSLLMCDPEWKIKTGAEIFIYIHRPGEDFSELLSRWRQTQVLLDNGYEWLLPSRYQHILGEGEGEIYPLFVVLEKTPERIKRGLSGAYLPFVVETLDSGVAEEEAEALSSESSTQSE